MAIPGTDLLEVPTVYKAYVRATFQGISPKNGQYLHFWILEFPLN